MGRDRTLLMQMQALPLSAKILITQQRIREWYNHFCGDVCVSFSGGKDSTVLAHLVHQEYPDVPLVFANTGLEYPEIQAFARKMGAEFIRPKMQFSEVISKYGYPIISKEVAEAIHFVRRIVLKSNEGGVHRIASEPNCTEREKQRDNPPSPESQRRMGGAGDSPQERKPHCRRACLDGTIPPSKKWQEWIDSQQRADSNSTGRDHGGVSENAAGQIPGKNKSGGCSKRELRRIQRARRQLLGKD